MTGPRWTDPKRQSRKTTPKYDPDTDQGKSKWRSRKPDAQTVKTFGKMTVEDGYRVYRYNGYNGKVYRVREKMTQQEMDDYVVQRWREATGRGTTFTGSDPGSADGDYGVTKVYENRLVHAGRMIGKRGTQVLIDELLAMDPDLFK